MVNAVTGMLRILVIDESHALANEAREALARAGYEVSAVIDNAHDLIGAVERYRPDVILIGTESPSRDTLEHLSAMDARNPHPVVMFAGNADADVIRNAVKAGVSAYVTDAVDSKRLVPIIEMACASFDRYNGLRRDYDEASRKLAERRDIERAKGIVMKARGMSEDEAYHALRKMAMERGKTLGATARDVIEMSSLLG